MFTEAKLRVALMIMFGMIIAEIPKFFVINLKKLWNEYILNLFRVDYNF